MNSGKTVLVVEDEGLIRLGVIEMLKEAGFVVFEADCASQAMEIINAKIDQIDALITDIRLGNGPDGWNVAQHARHAIEGIPIVFMSGDSMTDWSERGIARSVMLAKPVPNDHLLAALADGIAGRGFS